jgi:hypothetical protein
MDMSDAKKTKSIKCGRNWGFDDIMNSVKQHETEAVMAFYKKVILFKKALGLF